MDLMEVGSTSRLHEVSRWDAVSFWKFKHMAPLPGFSLSLSLTLFLSIFSSIRLSVKLWHSVVLILHINTVLFGFQSGPLWLIV